MSEIKYEAVFGDQSLFDGAPDDAEYAGWFCQETRWYMILNGKILFSDGGTWCTSDNPYLSADIAAMRRIIKTPVQHSDDVAVDLFAAKMKEKLEKSRDKGRSGWESCPIEHLIASLKDHISKGDPVDVANFAMMISQRGESIKTPVWTVADQKAGRLPEVGAELIHKTRGICEFIGVGLDEDACWALKQQSGSIYIADKSWCQPIETPEERAKREREEWCSKALDSAGILSEMKRYELKRLGEYIGSIHDALLSGELPMPGKWSE